MGKFSIEIFYKIWANIVLRDLRLIPQWTVFCNEDIQVYLAFQIFGAPKRNQNTNSGIHKYHKLTRIWNITKELVNQSFPAYFESHLRRLQRCLIRSLSLYIFKGLFCRCPLRLTRNVYLTMLNLHMTTKHWPVENPTLTLSFKVYFPVKSLGLSGGLRSGVHDVKGF